MGNRATQGGDQKKYTKTEEIYTKKGHGQKKDIHQEETIDYL